MRGGQLHCFLSFLTCLLFASSLAAQIPQSMVFTAGTTARDGGGQDHAFMLWEAPGADLLGGKTFAVYGKAGAAASPGTFTQEALISGSLQSAVITACLAQAESLGQNLDDFDSVLAGIHYGCFYPDPAPALTGDRVAKTITVLTKARTLPNLVGKLRTLVMVNPTLALCLGMAWSAPMSPAGITNTYELREWDTTANADGAVIGRVTLTGGAHVTLPAASRPVQVPDATPSGDLKVRLRWGVPDALKRRIILHQGFRLYRLPWALAQGYQNNAPTLPQLAGHITAGQAVLVTKKPLYIPTALSPTQAEDLTAPLDSQITYLDDDLGRLSAPANYVMPADGTEYGYIVVPRDLLGRHGLPSPAGYGRILRTQAPAVPREPKVELVFGAPGGDGVRPQHFHFSFLANDTTAADPTTAYEIYRGIGQTLDGQGLPIAGNMIDQVIHPAAPGRVEYDDMPPYPMDVTPAKQVWFCVRAVRSSPAGTFYSPLSAPVFSALVLNTPPTAPTSVSPGSLCPQPGITLAGTPGPVTDASVPADGMHHFRLICDRLDDQVLKASFSYRRQGQQTEEALDEIEFSSDDRVQVDFTLPDADMGQNTTFICRVQDAETGLPAANYFSVRPAGELAPDKVYVVSFLAAVLSPTTLDTANPVSDYFINTSGRRTLQSVVLAPGGRHVVTGHVSGLAEADGFLVQRLFGIKWLGVGFAQITSGDAEKVVFTDTTAAGPTSTAAHYRITPLQNLRSCSSGPTFVAVTSRDGKANGVRNCLFYTPDPQNEVLEYRFYRRVNDGPLTLYAEGRVVPGLTPNPICETDFNLPATGGTAYYYGQVIGANGVGSGTVLVRTVKALPAVLPRPVLAEPKGSGDDADPKVTLTWTCPAESVQRFEVTLAPKGGDPITDSVPSSALGSIPRTRHRKPPSNSNAASLANALHIVPIPPVKIETLSTDRVGSASIGAGPVFTQEYSVRQNTDYNISVRAIGHDGGPGQDSAVYVFRWQLTTLNDPDIPWPFRALPSVSSIPGEVANMTLDDNTHQLPHFADPMIWPIVSGGQVGFAIGNIGLAGNGRFVATFMNSGQPGVILDPDENSRFGSNDFNSFIYMRNAETQDFVLPAVLYRQQLPNTEWPEVSGDVVQVSPLISRLLTTADPSEEFPNATSLRDPFIGVRLITGPPQNDELPDATDARLYLLDTTPRAVGAQYRYWLVCFDATTGAPEYVIPATLDKVTP